MDGFFADGGLLLIHDHDLRQLLDSWVRGLNEREFVDLLPLVRRTFGTFSAAERRAIADHIGPRQNQDDHQTADVDFQLAAPALTTVRKILGGGHD